MLQKQINFYNENKSFSINSDKNISNLSNLKIKYTPYLLSPKKSKLVESKSQTSIFSLKKSVKISFNKYHQYIKNLKNEKRKNEINRPLSNNFKNINKNVSFNKNTNNNNNRKEIEGDYSFMTKHKSFYDKNINNSPPEENTTLLLNFNYYNTNLRQKKLNMLNIAINSQSTKNSSYLTNYKNNNNTSIFTKTKNNSILTKNIANMTLKKLKNSKFFYKTKYVMGVKNKNNKNIKNPSLSTYNISFNPENKNDLLYNSLNSLIENKLLNKMKIAESEESNDNDMKLKNVCDKGISTQDEVNRVQFYDFLPVILNNMKQRQTVDDIYSEYNQYLSNISKSTKNSNSKKNVIGYGYKYPKIKYLFLENVINSLKHMVKFVNVKNNEELERNVINIIRSEYSKIIENNNEMSNIKDFLTYGYEYVPKRKSTKKLPFLEDKGLQLLGPSKNSIFFINEQKIDEIHTSFRENSIIIKPTKNLYIKSGTTNKKLIFEKLENKSRNINKEQKEELNSIFSSYSIKENKSPEKKSIKSLLKNQQLKTLNILKKKISQNYLKEEGKKEKSKPKFIKINLKGFKVKDDLKDNSSIKNDISNKNNETLSIFDQIEAKEIIENDKETLNEEDLNIKNVEENKKHDENKIDKKENINNKNNLNNISPHKKEKIIKRSSISKKLSNIHKRKSNEKNINIKNNIYQEELKSNNANNNNHNQKEEIKEEIKDDKSADENNEDNNEDSNSSINEENKEQKNEEINEEEKNKEEKEMVDKLENFIEELEDPNKKISEIKRGLKKNKTGDFLKSIQNTLIALNQIKKHALKKTKTSLPMYNELMYYHRHRKEKENEDQSQENSNSKSSNLSSKNNKYEKEKEPEEEKLITVSSISNYSINEPNEFVKLKSTIHLKTKKEAFDEEKRINTYRRRDALINPSTDTFQGLIKSKEIEDLNSKMKKLYDNIHKEKKKVEYVTKKRKNYIFSFAGINTDNFDNIEIRKKVNLNRLKEDIKFKIIQGKYHVEELDNFKKFSNLIESIDFKKYKNDKKKLFKYMHLVEKYFQLYYNELIIKERQNNDEKRINKFLDNLKENIGETIPFVTNYKGKFCRPVDLNKEGDLSILNLPTDK